MASSMNWNFLLTLIWIIGLHSCGIFLFTKGFFLTRYEVPQKSQCSINPSPIVTNYFHLNTQDSSHQDYIQFLERELGYHNQSTIPVESSCWFPKRFERAVILIIDALRIDYMNYNDTIESTSTRNNQNKLPILHQLLREQPQKSLLWTFRADPPTATMQRLKGLTTGGLPTFIDISNNFDSSAINEDNLIYQLLDNNKYVTFMGDDTWESLFPGKFARSFPFPSFNVKDLHTVDNGVLSHLTVELTDHTHPWSVVIAHFLGVDHVGHRYDTNHPTLAHKLLQMNKMIEEVIAVLDDNTLLIVMGDHGATDDGNHGGASEEELNAGMFMYSKTQILDVVPSHATQHQAPVVSQIDLVPTLSLLLGIPIPYGNLGSIIPEIFLQQAGTQSADGYPTESLKRAVWAAHINSWQIYNYLDTYSHMSSELSSNKMSQLKETFAQINLEFSSLMLGSTTSSSKSLYGLFHKYHTFQAEAVALCRQLWVSFDENAMISGVAILALAFICVTTMLLQDSPLLNFPVTQIAFGAVAGAAAFVARAGITQPLPVIAVQSVMGAAIGSEIIFLLFGVFKNRIRLGYLTDLHSMAALIAVGLHGAGLFSNSFIEAEYNVIRFLLWTLIIGLFISTDASANFNRHFVFLVIVTKASELSGGGLFEDHASSSLQFIIYYLIPLIGLAFYIIRTTESPSAQLISVFSLGCVALFWTLQHANEFEILRWPVWTKVALPQLVYWISLGGIAFQLFTPSLQPKVVLMWQDLGSVFSLLIAPIVLTLGLKGAFCILLLCLQSFLFRDWNKALKESKPLTSKSKALQDTRSNMILPIVVWCLFTVQYFFKSGHTYEFNSLQWAAAFVGFEEMNMVGGALLVFLNTFGPHILLTLQLPFLLLTSQQGKEDSNKILRGMLMYILFFAFKSVLTSTFVFMQRRHLMVWRVFAPKYVFDNVILGVIDVLVLLTFLIMWRSLSPPATPKKTV